MIKELLKSDSWHNFLEDEWQKPYIKELDSFLEFEFNNKSILPKKENIFESLNTTPLDTLKVVILGQDPYPTKGHAHGLSFSVLDGVNPLPKSLQNIYKELYSDLHIDNSHSGCLKPWAKQGVLLLNSVLSVEEGKANSHKDKGWEIFTDRIIDIINREKDGVVFVLWGKYAQKKGKNIDSKRHLIINDPHPSPLSAYRGFFGSKPFSKINSYLIKNSRSPIDWQL